MKYTQAFNKLEHNLANDPSTGCWLHNGYINQDGYSQISFLGKRYRGHRLTYELYLGPIPLGLVIDHLCQNRACVNPEHLEAVSSQKNTIRGSLGQYRRPGAVCKRGHNITVDNTYVSPNGRRRCRACRKL